MITTLQPHRPQRPAPPSVTPPSFQQTRSTAQAQPQDVLLQSPTSLKKPSNQLEAMPPCPPPTFAASMPQYIPPPSAHYDSAIRHPVFFTESLRKPPFQLPNAAGGGISPVAFGYVMEQRRIHENLVGKTKL